MNPVPRFMFPPHPKQGAKLNPGSLDETERKNKYIAQRKFQGSHAVIWIYNDQWKCWNRTGEPFAHYSPSKNMTDCINSLNLKTDTEYVLNGELLHTKAVNKRTKKQEQTHTFVLFDVLFAGKYLNCEKIEERLLLLQDICKNPVKLEPKKQAYSVVTVGESHIWLAEVFYNNFNMHFWEFCENELIEGLMLKQKGSINNSFGRRPNDVDWMIRCRKPKEKMYTL